MKQNKELKKIKQKIVKILKRNGVKKAGIFGSYARGEYKKADLVSYTGIHPKLKEDILKEEARII